VHPVTILSVDALATNLDFNHRDELLARVVEPAGICFVAVAYDSTATVLANLWESDLKVGAVGKVTIA
tara:strand:- start:56 stop:259 length:204 start_codon:yes stop_codon:yes gene_type:complete